MQPIRFVYRSFFFFFFFLPIRSPASFPRIGKSKTSLQSSRAPIVSTIAMTRMSYRYTGGKSSENTAFGWIMGTLHCIGNNSNSVRVICFYLASGEHRNLICRGPYAAVRCLRPIKKDHIVDGLTWRPGGLVAMEKNRLKLQSSHSLTKRYERNEE